ncbi:hypothetical protein DRQ18_03370 [bacterium]|nr:MAG: hypothetical protein DRQ18_03370 [bacterium]
MRKALGVSALISLVIIVSGCITPSPDVIIWIRPLGYIIDTSYHEIQEIRLETIYVTCKNRVDIQANYITFEFYKTYGDEREDLIEGVESGFALDFFLAGGDTGFILGLPVELGNVPKILYDDTTIQSIRVVATLTGEDATGAGKRFSASASFTLYRYRPGIEKKER